MHTDVFSTALRHLTFFHFLADRTDNGRAYATMLRLSSSVCRLSVRNVLWLNGAS